MNHLIMDDDTNGIWPFCSQSQALTKFYLAVTSLDKTPVWTFKCKLSSSSFMLQLNLDYPDFFSGPNFFMNIN